MKKYNDIQLFCVLPCNNHYENWGENYKNRLKNLMKNCTKNILVQKDYTDDCFFKRNKYLVDKSNVVLGVYNINLTKSGTKNTLKYAISQGKK